MLGGVPSGIGRPIALRSSVVIVLVCALAAACSGTAWAEVPTNDGGMTFADIQDASGSEEYRWKVDLAEDEELALVNEDAAVVYYLPIFGHTAFRYPRCRLTMPWARAFPRPSRFAKPPLRKAAKVVAQSHWTGAVLKPGATVGIRLA